MFTALPNLWLSFNTDISLVYRLSTECFSFSFIIFFLFPRELQ